MRSQCPVRVVFGNAWTVRVVVVVIDICAWFLLWLFCFSSLVHSYLSLFLYLSVYFLFCFSLSLSHCVSRSFAFCVCCLNMRYYFLCLSLSVFRPATSHHLTLIFGCCWGFVFLGGGFGFGRFRVRWGPKGHLTSRNPSLFCFLLLFSVVSFVSLFRETRKEAIFL